MGFGTVSRLFHWFTVLLVAVMIPVGVLMAQEIPRPLQDKLFIVHKGLGPVVLAVVVLRLIWRAFHPAPRLPSSVPPLQVKAANFVHAALYVFLLVQAISGYVRVTTGGFPIEALEVLGIGPLLPKAEGVAQIASVVHLVSAYCLVALIAIHVSAAAFHRLVKRDGVMSMMWPPVAPSRPPEARP